MPDPTGFTDFLDRNVTPRFPAGLTVLNGHGRWWAPDGRQTQEESRLVLIVVPREPDPRPALEAVRAEYKARFRQHSVGLLLQRTCAAF